MWDKEYGEKLAFLTKLPTVTLTTIMDQNIGFEEKRHFFANTQKRLK
jgi:hypothetical protein